MNEVVMRGCSCDCKTTPDFARDSQYSGVVIQASREYGVSQRETYLLQVLASGGHELHADELETLALEPGDDLADQTALNSVRLDHLQRVSGVCENNGSDFMLLQASAAMLSFSSSFSTTWRDQTQKMRDPQDWEAIPAHRTL